VQVPSAGGRPRRSQGGLVAQRGRNGSSARRGEVARENPCGQTVLTCSDHDVRGPRRATRTPPSTTPARSAQDRDRVGTSSPVWRAVADTRRLGSSGSGPLQDNTAPTHRSRPGAGNGDANGSHPRPQTQPLLPSVACARDRDMHEASGSSPGAGRTRSQTAIRRGSPRSSRALRNTLPASRGAQGHADPGSSSDPQRSQRWSITPASTPSSIGVQRNSWTTGQQRRRAQGPASAASTARETPGRVRQIRVI